MLSNVTIRRNRKGKLEVGDMGDLYRDVREYRRELRSNFGVPCPKCAEKRPKATPSTLLPGQKCNVDGYRDPRPRLTDSEISTARKK